MPKFNVRISTQHRGAIFNASQTKAAGKRMVANVNEKLAQEGFDRLHNYLRRVLQNPTGYYQSRVVIDRKTVNRALWDSGVLYGGWLEGIDPRNLTTRFRGYSAFRRVKQGLDQDAVRLAQPEVDKYVREMNS